MRRLHLTMIWLVLLLGLSACELALPTPLPAAMPESTPTAVATASAVVTPPTETPASSPTPLSPADMLWLANPADGNVRLIDPISGSVAVIIPTGMQPEQVVVGEGAAWALDRAADRVLRINLEDFAIEAMVLIPQGETGRLAVGAGYVWVTITERPSTNVLLPGEEYHEKGGVVRIDPQTGWVNGYAAVGPVADLSVSRGVLWTLGRGEFEAPLNRVDPASLKSVEIKLSGVPDWQLGDSLTASDNSLWVFSQSYGRLYRFSFDGKLYAELSLGQHKPIGPATLRPANRWLWLASPWGSVLQVDTGNNQVAATTDLGVAFSDILWSGEAAWAVSALEGKVFRFDPVSRGVLQQVEIGDRVLPTQPVTATPIIRAFLPCEDAPYSRLQVGDKARTQKEPGVPQRLRKEPGTEFERIAWIQPGETVLILEGPACVDGWVWWKVETLTGGYTGWAAEGDETEYWLFPAN